MSNQPYPFHMEPNVVYSWCSCGFSSTEPFCDSSHRTEAPEMRSVKFHSDKPQDVLLCMCKSTKNPPYCDGSQKECE